MVKISVLYPYRPGGKFDMAYYCDKHIPMVREKLGAVCKGVAVEHGVSSVAPHSTPAFIAMGHIFCDSAEAFRSAFGVHGPAIIGDVPNYTDIEPTIQISDVKISP